WHGPVFGRGLVLFSPLGGGGAGVRVGRGLAEAREGAREPAVEDQRAGGDGGDRAVVVDDLLVVPLAQRSREVPLVEPPPRPPDRLVERRVAGVGGPAEPDLVLQLREA